MEMPKFIHSRNSSCLREQIIILDITPANPRATLCRISFQDLRPEGRRPVTQQDLERIVYAGYILYVDGLHRSQYNV